MHFVVPRSTVKNQKLRITRFASGQVNIWHRVGHIRFIVRDLWKPLGGVYMTPGRLSRRREITSVPSHGSIFVYMIPPQNVLPAWVPPGCCNGARISLGYAISQRYHVDAKRPPVLVWNRSAGRLERVAHAWCLRFWIRRVFYQHEVYLQITRYEMT